VPAANVRSTSRGKAVPVGVDERWARSTLVPQSALWTMGRGDTFGRSETCRPAHLNVYWFIRKMILLVQRSVTLWAGWEEEHNRRINHRQ